MGRAEQVIPGARDTLRPRALGAIDAWLFAPIPRHRLTLLRMGVGIYALVYLVARAGHLAAPVDYPASSFAPVGLVSWLDAPLPAAAVYAGLTVAIAAAALFVWGRAYRWVAPCFALSLAWVLSYRHSFGMIFHTDNLLVMHVAVLACSGDAGGRVQLHEPGSNRELAPAWPARALCLVTVAAYVVAGIAKLEITGLGWAGGDVLREHIAFDAIRKIELGSIHSPLAGWLLPHAALFPPLAAFALATELLAPIALFGPRLALGWCVAAWIFHAGVLLLMAIAFPYPLSGCAFLAFFPLERWVARARVRIESRLRQARPRPES